MYKAAGLDGLGLDEGSFTSWASLVAQRGKRLPAMRETWVQPLGQEDPLEQEMATHSSVLAWKRLPAMQETWVQPLGQEDPLEKEMATHSSVLAWRIPWTGEPGEL